MPAGPSSERAVRPPETSLAGRAWSCRFDPRSSSPPATKTHPRFFKTNPEGARTRRRPPPSRLGFSHGFGDAIFLTHESFSHEHLNLGWSIANRGCSSTRVTPFPPDGFLRISPASRWPRPGHSTGRIPTSRSRAPWDLGDEPQGWAPPRAIPVHATLRAFSVQHDDQGPLSPRDALVRIRRLRLRGRS